MFLSYDGKKTEADILANAPLAKLNLAGKTDENLLIQGDNLGVLNALLKTHRGKIQLIYIDPPFATNSHFSIGETRTSHVSHAKGSAIAYSDKLLGADFLEFLRERLVLLRELLAPDGSIYLHIDYKIGHYVKLLMDEIFDKKNFRNDITRIKSNPKNFKRAAYGNIKDMILFYSRGKAPIWNDPRVTFTAADEARLFKKVDAAGRRYTTIPLHAPGETAAGPTGQMWRNMLPPTGRHWRSDPKILEEWDALGLIEWSKTGVPRKKIYFDERSGKKAQDIWDFKDPPYPSYPTEKNLDMLKFIVAASSNEGDVVLDAFAGSGTTLVAAQTLNRHWIGIDAAPAAIRVCETRLAALPPKHNASLKQPYSLMYAQ